MVTTSFNKGVPELTPVEANKTSGFASENGQNAVKFYNGSFEKDHLNSSAPYAAEVGGRNENALYKRATVRPKTTELGQAHTATLGKALGCNVTSF